MRKGILAGGNWIIDIVKIIDAYPPQEALANILSETYSNGGSPYNLLIDIAKLDVGIPLEAFGLVGDDEKGKFIINDCTKYGIDVSQLLQTSKSSTSYTDVMTVKEDGKRTFFHNRGANAYFDGSNLELALSNAKIFHLAYLLLLDKLDIIDEKGRTGASYLFEKAQKAGFKTSTDVVSENSDRFKDVVTSSLPFINYFFVNEFEASKITGIATVTNGKIDLKGCEKASKVLLEMGVNDWVILHFPKGCLASSPNETVIQGSINFPKEKIVGAVGAGDAFAAGVLAGIHEGLPIHASLKQGVSVAANCLTHATCSEGILPLDKCMELMFQYDFYEII